MTWNIFSKEKREEKKQRRDMKAQIGLLRVQMPGNTVLCPSAKIRSSLNANTRPSSNIKKSTELQSRIDELRTRYKLDHVPTPRSNMNPLASLELELSNPQADLKRQNEEEVKQNAWKAERELKELELKERESQRIHELQQLDREASVRLELEKSQQSTETTRSFFQTVALAGVACFVAPAVVGAAATTATVVGLAGAAAGAVAYVGGEHQRQQTERKMIEAQAYVYGQASSNSPRLITGSLQPYTVEEPE